MKRIFLTCLLLAANAAASFALPVKAAKTAPLDPLAQANLALQNGEADRALSLLLPDLLPKNREAEVHHLRCRVLYSLERWNEAVDECEEAVKLNGSQSNYHLWLGRALGEKADRASFLSAYGLAKRVRSEFETAVQLDPRNAEALADLGEFYYSAPGAVGGGSGKAENIAAQLDKVDPARAHELRARIAAEQKDYATAEKEFRQAIAVSAHPAFQWMTLAGFYRGRSEWTEMETAIHSGLSAFERDKHSAVALYNGASVLTRANRDPQQAEKMLETYLASTYKTEEAPAFAAHARLARILDQLGDHQGAQRERSAAQSLAAEYNPAQESKR